MLRFSRAIKFAAIVGVAAATLAAGSTASRAESGSVRLHIVKAGLIVGVGGGSGTLVFKGRSYRLSLGGIGVGSLGVAAVDLVGTASHLRHPGDIAGTYGAAGAGGAFVAGAQVARLQNEKGVILEVHGVQVGFGVLPWLLAHYRFALSRRAAPTLFVLSGTGVPGCARPRSSTAGRRIYCPPPPRWLWVTPRTRSAGGFVLLLLIKTP